MNIPDAYSHPLFNADIDRATHFHTRNILCTAIKDMSGRNIAVVQVGFCLAVVWRMPVDVVSDVSIDVTPLCRTGPLHDLIGCHIIRVF